MSLTSFILKLLERLIDRHLRELSFVENPLRKEQHAYEEGKSLVNTKWLANRGSRTIRATRCRVGLPACYLNELLEKWLGKIALKRWQEEKGLRQAKLLIVEQPSEAWLHGEAKEVRQTTA